MVDQLAPFAAEVTRVAKEVGTEGKLGGQADVKGVCGTWKDLTDNVNFMAVEPHRPGAQHRQGHDRGRQRRPVAEDHGRCARRNPRAEEHDQRHGRPAQLLRRRGHARGERSRHRGKPRRSGGRARVSRHVERPDRQRQPAGDEPDDPGARHRQSRRPPSRTATSRRKSRSMRRARSSQLKDTINTMVDQLRSFAAEVTRVAREVGTEGKLGGQAEVRGVSGTWKDLTDNVNFLPATSPPRSATSRNVTTAVANGDLSQKITVEAKGEILELKNTHQHHGRPAATRSPRRSPASRRKSAPKESSAARPRCKGVVGHLEGSDRQRQRARGKPDDPSAKHRARSRPPSPAATFAEDHGRREGRNPRAEEHHQHDGGSAQLVRSRRSRASPRKSAPKESSAARPKSKASTGTWKDLTDNVNVAGRQPHRPGPRHRQGRDRGRQRRPVEEDLRRRQRRDPRAQEHHQQDGRSAQLVRAPKSRASRKEVGTEGKLGGQAEVKGVSGIWKDLTDNVNFMASNLTNQVRGIVKVVTAVANGDLKQKLVLEAQGRGRGARRDDQQHDRHAAHLRRAGHHGRARGRHRREARRPGARCPASPARGRTSPTTSTSWPPTSRRRCAASSRS